MAQGLLHLRVLLSGAENPLSNIDELQTEDLVSFEAIVSCAWCSV